MADLSKRLNALSLAVEAERQAARARLNGELAALWTQFTDVELATLADAIQAGGAGPELDKFLTLGGTAILDRVAELYTPRELADLARAAATSLDPLRANLAAIDAGNYDETDPARRRAMETLFDALHDLN